MLSVRRSEDCNLFFNGKNTVQTSISSFKSEGMSNAAAVFISSSICDNNIDFRKKISRHEQIIQPNSDFNVENGDMKILQSQRFLENIKCQHNYNQIVYENLLRYLFEFTSNFIESLKSNDATSNKDFSSRDLRQKLQEQVSEIFAGLPSLIQEFFSFLYPQNKIFELNSYIGYELLSFPQTAEVNQSIEEQNNRMFSRYVAYVKTSLSAVDYLKWVSALEDLHINCYKLKSDLLTNLKSLNYANSFLTHLPVSIRDTMFELYSLPVHMSPISNNPSFGKDKFVDDQSLEGDQLFRNMVRGLAESIMTTFCRAHHQIFKYLHEILYKYFGSSRERISGGGLCEMIESIRILFEHAPLSRDLCLSFIRFKLLYKLYAYVTNMLLVSVRCGADLKLTIDEETLIEKRTELLADISGNSLAAAQSVTEGNKRLIIGIQNLQCSYAMHRRGGNVSLVNMLQRINEVVYASHNPTTVRMLFTLFPLVANTYRSSPSILANVTLPILRSLPPKPEPVRQSMIIRHLTMEAMQACGCIETKYSVPTPSVKSEFVLTNPITNPFIASKSRVNKQPQQQESVILQPGMVDLTADESESKIPHLDSSSGDQASMKRPSTKTVSPPPKFRRCNDDGRMTVVCEAAPVDVNVIPIENAHSRRNSIDSMNSDLQPSQHSIQSNSDSDSTGLSALTLLSDMAALKAMSPSLQKPLEVASQENRLKLNASGEVKAHNSSSIDKTKIRGRSGHKASVLSHEQEVEHANLLHKLEKMYKLLVDMELKNTAVGQASHNSNNNNNGTHKNHTSLPLSISNGLVLHVDKDMVRKWIENLLRLSKGQM